MKEMKLVKICNFLEAVTPSLFCFVIITQAIDSQAAIIPLIFGVLCFFAMLYEIGYKRYLEKQNKLRFILVYIIPALGMVFFIAIRLMIEFN